MQTDKTIFDSRLADQLPDTFFVSKKKAEELFQFFKTCPLFRWQDANNDCEDRANAACLLLDKWGIPNCKAWAFGGFFLKKDGGKLTNNWNYHVAAALPVQENGGITSYVLDPATLNTIDTLDNWAEKITDNAHSYHFVKSGEFYIFNPTDFDNWHKRNSQNFKWTMQGLAGINGVTKTGKAQLVFNKKRIAKTAAAFQELLKQFPLSS